MQVSKVRWLVGMVLLVALITAPVAAAVPANEWCGMNNLYFQDHHSGVDGFNVLSNYASVNASTDETITVKAADGVRLIDKYLSEAGTPGTGVVLTPGLRQYNMYSYASSVAQPSYFTFNVSRYNVVTGAESFYYNITSTKISSVVPTNDRTVYVSQSTSTFQPNERLAIYVYGYTTSVTNVTIHLLNQGTTSPTYIQTGYYNCPSQIPDVRLLIPYGHEFTQAIIAGIAAGLVCLVLYERRRRGKKE